MSLETLPDLSVVILSWNTQDLLRECLRAVQEGAGDLRLQVVVVENASSDGSAEMVAVEFPQVRLLRNPVNRGYAAGVNQGIRESAGRRICLLGSDTRVGPEALPRLCAFLDAHPEVGAVAPRLLNPDGSVQRACMRFPTLRTVLWWDTPLAAWFPEGGELRRYQMREWDHRGTREVEQPPGTCLVVPREVVERVGLLDERLWLFFNDVDWALRIRQAGYPLWYLDEAEVVHHLGASTRQFQDFAPEWHRNRVRFYRKHHHLVGAFLTKAAVIYVALRQCWRLRRDLTLGREYLRQVRQILHLLVGLLRE